MTTQKNEGVTECLQVNCVDFCCNFKVAIAKKKIKMGKCID